MEYNGLIVVDKAKGIGSTDTVRIIKKKLKQRSVGHSGTLDFLATGVLVICLGKATKLIEYLQMQEKVYEAGMILGLETDTYDIEGEILNRKKSNIHLEDLLLAKNKFIGNIEQIPPMYSALKVQGERLYNLARKGIEVERNARLVTINSIDIIDFDYDKQRVLLKSNVGSGTYIRSLIYDLGKSLGTYGTMESLRRLKCSGYNIEDAIKVDWDTDSEKIISNIIPIDEIKLDMNSLLITEEIKIKLLNGMNVLYEDVPVGNYRVFFGSNFIGVGKIHRTGKGTFLKLTKHLIEHGNN